MLRQFGDFTTGPVRRRSCPMWDEPGMLLHFIGRSSLRSLVQQRFVVGQRRFCEALSVRCAPDPPQQADMIRNRAQIKRVLCVAEKNDAAKGISEIMSNGRSRRVRLVLRPAVCKSGVSCLVNRFNISSPISILEPMLTLIAWGWLNLKYLALKT